MPDIVLPLTVRDLTEADLPHCGWSGVELAYRAEALASARRGDVDYLAVCPPSGRPVATGGVDFRRPLDGGTLWQLSVDESLRGCGIGTLLVRALEQRIRDRSRHRAELGVDHADLRPQKLYERLGYRPYGTEAAAWDQQSPGGSVRLYRTTIIMLSKQLD